ncbi:MAG TPA: prepilin-type N-terminal cleavage/methylation domain-containing protein [Candidatus Dormibacteraeota bacterium]|nr:prepilin-type N-terminal cleavage/methylation domain-containing protein [Candidatus Dormibacteraeota bacterium]
MRHRGGKREGGFSLLELMTATGIFLVVVGAAFGLLIASQKAYSTQSQALSAFQEARLGLDQIVRDVNIAGYPPPGQFSDSPSDHSSFAETPVAWAPGYSPGTSFSPCAIGSRCTTPADYDLIIETNVNPQAAGSKVKWVRYQLAPGGTTLMRGFVDKATDPDDATLPTLVPFVQNVMNNASAAQIAQYQAIYPTMFPGGAPVPIFKYFCGVPGKQCTDPGGNNAPANIRDVEVTLIVASAQVDANTGQPRLVVLNGRGHLVNPTQ